jgi:hypothetical protein
MQFLERFQFVSGIFFRELWNRKKRRTATPSCFMKYEDAVDFKVAMLILIKPFYNNETNAWSMLLYLVIAKMHDFNVP